MWRKNTSTKRKLRWRGRFDRRERGKDRKIRGLSSTKRHKKNILFLLQTQQARWPSSGGGRGEQKVLLSSSNNILTIRRATGLRSIEEPEAYTPSRRRFWFRGALIAEKKIMH